LPTGENVNESIDRRPRGLVQELLASHRFAVAVLSLLLVVSLGSTGYLLFVTQPKVESYVEMTRRARDAHSAMLDQETGLRGWLATGNRVFLEPYVDGRKDGQLALGELLAMAHDESEVTDLVVTMMLARQRWQTWAEEILRTGADLERTSRAALADSMLEGKRLFDRYRDAAAQSTGLLRDRRLAALDDQRRALEGVLAAYVLVLVGTFAAAWQRRRRLQSTVVDPLDRLEATIAAFRDGDLDARFAPSGVRELDSIGAALHRLAADLSQAGADAAAREQRLAFLADRFETVVRVGREIAGSLSVRYVSSAVSDAAADLLGADTTLWVRGDQRDFGATHRSGDPHGTVPPVDLTAPEVVLLAAADARPTTVGAARAYPLVLAGMVVAVLETTATDVNEETQQVLSALLATAAAALESAQLHSAARELADMDALTHLPNRRRFSADIEAEWERCQRYGRPLSLVMIDLDHFKRLNDTHGHLTGDHVLRLTAEAIVGQLRASDTGYRYGGEEIAVLLRETELEDGTAVAERIRAAIEAVVVSGVPVTVTASLGVAERDGAMTHHNDLVLVADTALYDAKRQGRNRVVTGPVTEHPPTGHPDPVQSAGRDAVHVPGAADRED
jgi:diguanylate cyclase (GGDEF)-like protein